MSKKEGEAALAGLSENVDEIWDGDDVDDVDGLVDETAVMTDDEREHLRNSVRPVKLMLAKVCISLVL